MSLGESVFSELAERERQSKLLQLGREKGKVLVWDKNQPSRSESWVSMHNPKNLSFILDPHIPGTYKNPLVSFELSGVRYFSKCSLKTVDGKSEIIFSETVYKIERRRHYRFLTYPHRSIFATIPLNEKLQASKVASFQTAEEKDMFKEFITRKNINTNQLSARIFDFSISGLCILVASMEKKILENVKSVEKVQFKLDENDIILDRCEIRYIIPISPGNQSLFKVGLEFSEVSGQIEETLGRHINQSLREEEEFEKHL